ncbi:MAG: DUF4199 domain-containing protein [Flavobacteriaceae bacterium]|nr:DUF4199 domain-containing protein [Flavobacteriaceae bacterium]
MKDQEISTRPVILNYGVILGVVSILFAVALYAVNGISTERPFWQKAVSILIIIYIIILGIRKFKELNNGILSLGQAMKAGLGISLIGGLINGVYIFIFFGYIEPDFINQIMETAQETMLEQNPDMNDDQIELAMSISSKFASPRAMLLFSVIGNLFFGAIISLIGGVTMKKEEEVY